MMNNKRILIGIVGITAAVLLTIVLFLVGEHALAGVMAGVSALLVRLRPKRPDPHVERSLDELERAREELDRIEHESHRRKAEDVVGDLDAEAKARLGDKLTGGSP